MTFILLSPFLLLLLLSYICSKCSSCFSGPGGRSPILYNAKMACLLM